MKPENKQLTSRQDILNVWVSKGASINGMIVQKITETIHGTRAMKIGKYGMDTYWTVIYEILYSPESNFFEVMFGNGVNIYGKSILELKHKSQCVNSPDPLQYLLSVLNKDG